MDDNLIDLTGFVVHLRLLSNNEAEFTIEQYIAALEATTTLTELTVNLGHYEATRENIRRVIEPLCRCISNLRLHNAQHPLRKLRFALAPVIEGGMLEGVLAQFLVAAKQFGTFHMQFIGVNFFTVQLLVEFCRGNESLKVLELNGVSFSGGGAALPLPVKYGPRNNSVTLTLDELTLHGVSSENYTAAAVFANLVAHVNVSSLVLGKFHRVRRNDDAQITQRINIRIPSAEQLTLHPLCRMGPFKAALKAGKTSVTDLNIILYDGNDKTARLELVARSIRRWVILNSLTITSQNSSGPHISLPPRLFQALEACTTVMQIQVIRCKSDLFIVSDIVPDVSPDEGQHLEKITSRNRELDRFAANPATYPTDKLLNLMLQFNKCRSGRYMLARHLPGVLPFAELHVMHLSRRRTNPPSPKKSKLH